MLCRLDSRQLRPSALLSCHQQQHCTSAPRGTTRRPRLPTLPFRRHQRPKPLLLPPPRGAYAARATHRPRTDVRSQNGRQQCRCEDFLPT